MVLDAYWKEVEDLAKAVWWKCGLRYMIMMVATEDTDLNPGVVGGVSGVVVFAGGFLWLMVFCGGCVLIFGWRRHC